MWCGDVLLILSKSQCRNTLTLTCLIFFPGRTVYYPSVLLYRRDEMSTTSHRWLSASSVLRHFLRINNVPSHNFVLFRPSIKYWFKCLVFFLSHILRMYNFSMCTYVGNLPHLQTNTVYRTDIMYTNVHYNAFITRLATLLLQLRVVFLVEKVV